MRFLRNINAVLARELKRIWDFPTYMMLLTVLPVISFVFFAAVERPSSTRPTVAVVKSASSHVELFFFVLFIESPLEFTVHLKAAFVRHLATFFLALYFSALGPHFFIFSAEDLVFPEFTFQ